MARNIRLGIIGCGIISGAHFKAGIALDDVEVIATCDVNQDRVDQMMELFSVPKGYTDWKELVASDDIDGVVICLPEGLHATVAIFAAEHGKHVFVEKPMSRNLREADDMIDAADSAGVVLMVGQVVRRFMSHVLAKEWIEAGHIGVIKKIDRFRLKVMAPDFKRRPWMADPKMNSDWLLYGFGAHEYDSVLWLLDADPSSVIAKGHRSSEWNCWDDISCDITFDNDVTAHISMSIDDGAGDKEWRTEIVGSEGTLSIYNDKVILNGEEIPVDQDTNASFTNQLDEFVDCIRTGREPGPSGKNVEKTMRLLSATHQSATEERSVSMDELV